jgi:hypothetical protein
MSKRAIGLFAAIVICMMPAAASAQLSAFNQDFESLVQSDTGALGADGWLYFANVFTSGGGYLYGYGVGPAPNDPSAPAFSLIAAGEGGGGQGAQQLVTFSDYNNADHGVGNLIETNIFQERVVGAADIGTTWNFDYEAKRGDLAGASTAFGFIKTLDPNNGYQLSNFFTEEMTAIPTAWGTYQISIVIDVGLVGHILQFGFLTNASNFEPSGIFYDNVNFSPVGSVPVSPSSVGSLKTQFR